MTSERAADTAQPGTGEARVARPEAVDYEGLEGHERELVEEALGRLTDPSRPGPRWSIKSLPGGATNMNYLVTERDEEASQFVLRVSNYDTERMGGTRTAGLRVQSAAAEGGVGAAVLAYWLPEGHSLSRFIPGEALDADLLRERDHWAAAARLLRRLHDLPAVEATWSAYRDIEHYLGIARAEGLELPEDLDRLEAAVEAVRSACDDRDASIGFCHNDLQIQNFIDDGSRLWLLDWEWAGMGDRYFDLGGFLVNAAADEDERRRFLSAYFDGDYDESTCVARCQLMELVSAVREAAWAVAVEPVLTNEWNYKGWAAQYFGRAREIIAADRFDELVERVRAANAPGGSR